jgi:hypothetical protein
MDMTATSPGSGAFELRGIRIEQPDSGVITVNGTEVTARAREDAIRQPGRSLA